MSNPAYVAISANGRENVRLAGSYGASFGSRGVETQWTLPPELSEEAAYSSSFYLEYEMRNPEQFRRRQGVIQSASALVVVNAVEEHPEYYTSGGSWGWSRNRGVWTPREESQLDMAMALGAGVPVFMPEGLPELQRKGEEDVPMASPKRLHAMGVLATPRNALQHGYPGEHVDFILSAIEQRATNAEALK